MMFGTPTLLWRVLHFAGYYESPLYHWNEIYLEGLVSIACIGPACSDGSSAWSALSEQSTVPILDDEDPDMLVEDDGWDEEEVEPENEEDPISDLDSDHDED